MISECPALAGHSSPVGTGVEPTGVPKISVVFSALGGFACGGQWLSEAIKNEHAVPSHFSGVSS